VGMMNAVNIIDIMDGLAAGTAFIAAAFFLFVAIITMIGYFQLFAEPYVMTQGGPLRSTTSIVLLMYEEGFRWWRMGVASAIAFLLLIITLLATLLQMRLQKGGR